jgi:hypothetical protein
MLNTLNLPAQRDPVARLALLAIAVAAVWLASVMPSAPPVQARAVLATPQPIIVIATPTLGLPEPTAAPVVLAQPTEAPPTVEPATAEPEIVYVEVTPVPTEAPPPEPTAEPVTALPAGSIVILPTATQTREEFIASFGPTPDPAAKCAFVGCLHQP